MALTFAPPEASERFTALVVGRSKIGKTSLLRTIDPAEGIVVLSAESGLLSVRDIQRAGHFQVVAVKSVDVFQNALMDLRAEAAAPRFKWIFIDSLTEIAAQCMEAWSKKYPDNKDSFNRWNAYENQMLWLIKGFRDLEPYNVVFTCQESVEQDDVKRRFIAAEIKHKGLKSQLPYIFDEILYYTQIPDDKGALQRVLLTDTDAGRPGGDRSGQLAPVEYPHLGYLRDKILGLAPRQQ